MSKDDFWNVSRVRVPARSGETLQMINAYDEAIRLSGHKLNGRRTLTPAEATDLDQFSDKTTADLPMFFPVKPHRSGFHDNDNAPYAY